MAEYIEREALLKDVAKIGGFPWSEWETAGVFNVITKQPIADVVPVVRCKDCKYWQDNNGGYPHEECRWGKDETPDPDDYCSYGEREEDT